MKIKSLGLKVSLIVAVMIVLIVVVILLFTGRSMDRMILEIAEENALVTDNVFSSRLQTWQDEALDYAALIAQSGEILDAVRDSDTANLQRILESAYMLSLDAVTLTDTYGNVLARGHSDQTGDNISGRKTVASALGGTGFASIEKDEAGGLFVRGSAPIYDVDGDLVGAVVCSRDLSLTKYVDMIKASTNCEITIFSGDTRMNTTLTNEDGSRTVGTQASPEVAQAVLVERQDYSTRIELFGNVYGAHYSPLIADGEVLGMCFAGVSLESLLKHRQDMMNGVIIVGIAVGLISVFLIFAFNFCAVSRPLKKIAGFADKIRAGELGISSDSQSVIAITSADEIGILARTLEQAYSQLQGYVGEIKERMQGLAEGDLISESAYEFRGDFSLIKDSINEIVHNLNSTMSEISISTEHVASASKQIADGAQLLAQGSTEQAASVQQLSASIAEISDQTRRNAEKAVQAADLANTIKAGAEKGNRQMHEMTSAVHDINQASQSISRVIKVINDIAFQTNILALNAAVEAARAGQHGKGFAVVAEEVRNLAAKSAEAAKDTGNLIANSMEKAALGARIADETAASLADIVSGINESSMLIGEIARSSEQQSASIGQINTGIGEVTQVIQQNSATAEQSAAASQEMNAQSVTLEELISQFKIGGAQRRNLRPAPREESEFRLQATGDGNYGKY